MSNVSFPSKWTDPPQATVIPVRAGESVLLEFKCQTNEAKVVRYSLLCKGLGSWCGERFEIPLAPFGSGSLNVDVHPDASATAGQYPFSIEFSCDEEAVEGTNPLSLVLQVLSAYSEIEPSEPVGEVKKEETHQADPPIVVVPKPIVQEEVLEPVKPKPKPKPQIEPPKVVTLQQREPAIEPVSELLPSADQTIANPANGSILYARPGEKLLVRIGISNDQSGVRTYVLQEDRSLPNAWINLVRDQVNITPNGTGDLAFSLTPPGSAEPANYPFTVSYGVLGKPLVSLYLVLGVQPTPSLTLEAKAPSVLVGPFSKSVPIELKVHSAGNSDTAYRLAVIEQPSKEDGQTLEPTEVYENQVWQFLFDHEFDNLVAPGPGRPDVGMVHHLNLVRKGTWWLGWKETCRARVRAIPVTDASNGAKNLNEIMVTGSRWRILPMPALVFFPILAVLLVLLGSGGDDLQVTNGLQGDDGAFYVTQSDKAGDLPVHLKWTAPFYSLLRMDRVDQGRATPVAIHGDTATDAPGVIEYGQAQRISYELGSRFFGRPIKADVRLVPARTSGMLDISVNGQSVHPVDKEEKIGDEDATIKVREITIPISSSGVTSIRIQNLTGSKGINGQTVVLWTLRRPSGFSVNDFLMGQGDNQPINPGAPITAKVSIDSANLPSNGEANWELLTTDSQAQLLRIHLVEAGS